MGIDTLIFLLQHLGIVINAKKSVVTSTRTIEFLGVFIDSNKMKMELSLPGDKVLKIHVKLF